MRLAPVAVVCSFALSAVIVGMALWATPGVRFQFAGYGARDWAKASVVMVPLVAVCAWPWGAALVRSFTERGSRSAILFSAISASLAFFFYAPISDAPAEGVGYNVLFYVLLAWLAYPLSLVARTKSSEARWFG